MQVWSLFDWQTLLAYSVAAIALIISPGPGQALVIARTIQGGTRAGVLTACGLQIGTLVHTLAASVGLSAILAASATAFTVVKYAGAAYLVVLGVLTLRGAWLSKNKQAPTAEVERTNDKVLLAHALATGILNPKVAIFFLAFLPQFVHPERGGVLLQFMVLGVLLSVLGLIGDSVVAWLAGRARTRMAQNERLMRWRETFTGTVLVGLGVHLALGERS
jgi:threonine/homoserine/homoserine lactone efflux protein